MANVKNVAGKAKYILSGKNIKDAIDDKSIAEKGLSALKKAKNLSEADKEALKAFENIDNRLGKVIKREKIKTYGARAGVGALGAGTAGAGAYGIYKHNKNKKEKTALDIVVDAFEKNAGFREDVKNLRTAQKAYRAVKKEKGVVNSARERALRYAKAARDTAFEDARKSGANAVKKRAVPIAVGAGALGAGAIGYGVSKPNTKKKEKTAYDIVVDAFEKIALEEQ